MTAPRFALSRLPLLIPAILALASPSPAGASWAPAGYSLEVLVDGVPLDMIGARGTTYIEAPPDREYSVRLSNHTGERVAVALSVDGLNSIDARHTPAADGRKWILAPYQSIEIHGWQTSRETARRFYFTTEERSYGAWMGKTKDLGLISAAFFREKRTHQPIVDFRQDTPAAPPRAAAEAQDAGGAPGEPSSLGKEAGPDGRNATESRSGPTRKKTDADDLAATGMGRELPFLTTRIPFAAEETPAAVIDLRYEYREALVRLGVVEDCRRRVASDLERRQRASGFEEMSYAPVPGCRSRR